MDLDKNQSKIQLESFLLNCTRMMTAWFGRVLSSQRDADCSDFKTSSGVTVEGLEPEGLAAQPSDPWPRKELHRQSL